MQTVKELARHASPGGRPQPLAFHSGKLWVGCWDTSHLYAIDPHTGTVLDEVPAPGKPYGLAAFGGALHVVVALEEDDRYFYRFAPGHGFDLASKTACPDLTGSHLASDGRALYLLQMSNRRLIELDAMGTVVREIALPAPIAGIGVGSDVLYAILADEDYDNMQLATLDIANGHAAIAPIATLPAAARALAFDGTAWWTSRREENEIASFMV